MSEQRLAALESELSAMRLQRDDAMTAARRASLLLSEREERVKALEAQVRAICSLHPPAGPTPGACLARPHPRLRCKMHGKACWSAPWGTHLRRCAHRPRRSLRATRAHAPLVIRCYKRSYA